MLRQLNAIGLSPDFQVALKVLSRYYNRLIRKVAVVSRDVTAVLHNVYAVVFRRGNKAQAKFTGGVHIADDINGGDGGLRLEVDRLLVSALATSTPFDLHSFFVDPEQAQRKYKRALKRQQTVDLFQDEDEASAFRLSGSMTLADMRDASFVGSVRSLMREEKAIYKAFPEKLEARLVWAFLNLVSGGSGVRIGLTTKNDLEGASVRGISLSEDEIEVGLKTSYSGPLSLESIAKLVIPLVNAQTQKIKEQQTERGQCLERSKEAFSEAIKTVTAAAVEAHTQCDSRKTRALWDGSAPPQVEKSRSLSAAETVAPNGSPRSL